jgi:HAD superfamily hydrolase (TIGR01509 family)
VPCNYFDAVLIDLDGTLLDTERVYRAAFFAALGEFGLAASEYPYNALIGRTSPDRRRILAKWFGPGFPADELFATYRRLREERLTDGVALKPGAAALLATLETGGIAFAFVTAASRPTATLRLRQAGIAGCGLVTRNDVPRSKPDPACLLLAASRLRAAPERCLVIEDSASGLAAGHAAGMTTVLVPDVDLPDATGCLVVRNLYDVAAMLQHSAPRYRTPKSRDRLMSRANHASTETSSAALPHSPPFHTCTTSRAELHPNLHRNANWEE